MSIRSNASTLERTSPYYKKNKKLCEDWEAFIRERGGKLNAVYNAWSLDIKSKVKTHRTWLINVQKATYSNGVLIFSAKYQNLEEVLEFQTKFSKSDCPNFYLGRSKWRRRKVNHPLFQELTDLIRPEIEDESLFEAKFKNGLLILKFHHKNDDFDLVRRVLSFRFENSNEI